MVVVLTCVRLVERHLQLREHVFHGCLPELHEQNTAAHEIIPDRKKYFANTHTVLRFFQTTLTVRCW